MTQISEADEFLFLLEQEERERVAPKLEIFRKHKRIKVAYGGRGAGAKSWGFASLIVQLAHRQKIRVLCTREIQQSLDESVFALIRATVERLGYHGWVFTQNTIKSPCGSRFSFHGLKDLRAANQIKGFENVDICWVEEAATVSSESWNVLIPTIRKPGSEIWISFNQETDSDPVVERFVSHPRDDATVIWLEPGATDNPWWTDELQKEMEEEYKRDPDSALHIWGGQPRKQGQYSVMSRASVRGAMDRNIQAEGAIEVGVDVARYGVDKTIMYKRKGLKIIDFKSFVGQDTQRTALEAWELSGRDRHVTIKVDDTGVGGGVTDALRSWGAKVQAVNFGGVPAEKDKFTSAADEMWFNFPVDEADIPNDHELMAELSGRQYKYDNKGRRKIEAKEDFKKRLGRSPDKADALLLCFYESHAGAEHFFGREL